VRTLSGGIDGSAGVTEHPHDENPRAAEARYLSAEIVRRTHGLAEAAPPDWFFCHITAAVLWGLPVPLRLLRAVLMPVRSRSLEIPPRGVDVGVIAPRRASKAAGTRGHQFSQRLTSIRIIGGVRVSSPASTWAMLADELSVDELVEVGDAIVRVPRRRGMQRGTDADALATVEQLRAALNAPYRRHTDKLRAALELIRVGSSSPAETRIRLAGSRAGLPQPHLDYDVFALDGEPIGFTEFAYPAYRQLIEYEGDHHRTDRKQWQRDVEKHARASTPAGRSCGSPRCTSIPRPSRRSIAFVRPSCEEAGVLEVTPIVSECPLPGLQYPSAFM
jgi:hypothetical protein